MSLGVETLGARAFGAEALGGADGLGAGGRSPPKGTALGVTTGGADGEGAPAAVTSGMGSKTALGVTTGGADGEGAPAVIIPSAAHPPANAAISTAAATTAQCADFTISPEHSL
ncbi:hypothetical protein ACFV0L_22325 [Streptosporangium canum]|uniref:hypothetical protein n=1 Tax=Streptosporangium canum TaxID=324952 RepID=UPI0036BC68AD